MVFDLTTQNATITSETGVTFAYYLTSADAISETNAITVPTAFTNTSSTQVIYVNVQNTTSSCSSIAELSLTVNPTPATPSGNAVQTFCTADAQTIADLVVAGSDLVWYDNAVPANVLPTTTLLTATTYYVASNNGICESPRLAITTTEDCPFTGCLTAPNGQYPSATFTPACLGNIQNITTLGYAGEYSLVNVVTGTEYTFGSSITTDVITISDNAGTIVYSAGINGSLVWTSTVTEAVRFYVHVDETCVGATTFRARTVLCGTPPPAPANDDCLNATVLTPGGDFSINPVTGTNVGATNSGETAPGCANFLGGDVWYSAMVPASGSVTFEVNGATGDLTDTGGAVYSGTCGSLVLISCNDSTSANGDHPLITVTGQTPGTVLYFSVWEYGNDTFGTFQVSAYDASLSASTFDNASFIAYPNPVKDVLNLSYSSEISSVKVINLLGQEVISRKVNNTTSQIDMTNLTVGAYIVNVTIGDVIKTIKVIKQ